MADLAVKAVQDAAEDESFWDEVAKQAALALGPVALRVVLGGAEAASQMGAIVDFDGLHVQALSTVRTWLPDWWATVEATTREAMREAMRTWVEQGLGKRGLPDLIGALEPLFGESRAERIASTESTRLFAQGNDLAYADDDTVAGWAWNTAADERVCPVCGPRHGHIWPKGFGPAMPAHVRCRCWKSPATWAYIRKHLEFWHGVEPPAEEDLLAGLLEEAVA